MGAQTLLTFDMSVDFMWNTLKQKTRQDDDIDGAGDGAGHKVIKFVNFLGRVFGSLVRAKYSILN